MRKYLNFSLRWFVAVWILMIGMVIAEENNILKTKSEIHQIRRLYLDVMGIPPTPQEIEWFTVYETNGYEVAVNWVCNKMNLDKSWKDYYKSKSYTTQLPHLMGDLLLERIIKYQSGKPKASLQEAEQYMIQTALKASDGNIDGAIDYMSECLTNRVTSTEEINNLLREFHLYPDDTSGLNAVLAKLKQSPDYRFK